MAKATIRDVARHAGVSIATVSHVINNTRFVMEETKQRVLASIDTLGYTPNVMARGFKQGRRNLIGFVVPDIANVFYSAIIEEAENAIAKHGYRLVTVHTKETKSREAENIRALASGIVDGIIVTSTMERYSEIEPLVEKDFPLVFIDRRVPYCPCDTVLVNNYDAVYSGVQQLILDGHTRIGYIVGLSHLSTTLERQNAYEDALKGHGIAVDRQLIRRGDSMSQSAIPQARELLELGCTAIVVSNNVMTEDVLYFLEENGIPVGVPGGIDIVGYNDSGNVYQIMRSIHSIDQPTRAMGRAAGEQIIERINHPEAPVKQIILQAALTRKAPLSPPGTSEIRWQGLETDA